MELRFIMGIAVKVYDEQKTQEAVEKHQFYGISNSDFHIKEDLARGVMFFQLL